MPDAELPGALFLMASSTASLMHDDRHVLCASKSHTLFFQSPELVCHTQLPELIIHRTALSAVVSKSGDYCRMRDEHEAQTQHCRCGGPAGCVLPGPPVFRLGPLAKSQIVCRSPFVKRNSVSCTCRFPSLGVDSMEFSQRRRHSTTSPLRRAGSERLTSVEQRKCLERVRTARQSLHTCE